MYGFVDLERVVGGEQGDRLIDIRIIEYVLRNLIEDSTASTRM